MTIQNVLKNLLTATDEVTKLSVINQSSKNKQNKNPIKSAVASLAITGTILIPIISGSAAQADTVVTFDDLLGDNLLVPDGYGGITWDNNFVYYGFEQSPYNPSSPPNRVYGSYEKFGIGNISVPFKFSSPVTFKGASFSGLDFGTPVSFSLFQGGILQAISTSLTISSTPTFLSSGYTGLVDEVRVNWYNSFTVMDDVTYDAHSVDPVDVPEPASVLGLLALGALGVGSLKRKQQQKATVKA